MSRLKTLGGRVSMLEQRIAPVETKVAEPFYQSAAWRALIEEIKRERGSRCETCQKFCRVLGDHVKELKDGGAPLDKANVKLACWPCHTIKTNKVRAQRTARPAQEGVGV